MNYTKFNQWNEMFPNALNSLIENFIGDISKVSGHDPIWRKPAVNIVDEDEAFVIQLAIAGMHKDQITISLEENRLVISGDKEDNAEIRYTRREFNFAGFERVFELPSIVDKDKISARFEEGVLTVRAPKREFAQTKTGKKINIL